MGVNLTPVCLGAGHRTGGEVGERDLIFDREEGGEGNAFEEVWEEQIHGFGRMMMTAQWELYMVINNVFGCSCSRDTGEGDDGPGELYHSLSAVHGLNMLAVLLVTSVHLLRLVPHQFYRLAEVDSDVSSMPSLPKE